MLGLGRVFSSEAIFVASQLLFRFGFWGSIGALIAILVHSFKQVDMDEEIARRRASLIAQMSIERRV
jgi:hypothetical protein